MRETSVTPFGQRFNATLKLVFGAGGVPKHALFQCSRASGPLLARTRRQTQSDIQHHHPGTLALQSRSLLTSNCCGGKMGIYRLLLGSDSLGTAWTGLHVGVFSNVLLCCEWNLTGCC